ncbi:MAG: hypothetical protein V1487_01210 [bacterium]
MSKKFSLLVFLTISSFLLAGCTKPSAPTTQTTGQTVSESAEFAEAINSGKPTLCTLIKDTDKMEYFIKGKKMYVNMTNIIENKTVVSHMINDEKFFYMWTDGQKQGSKINLLVSPSPAEATPTTVAKEGTPKFASQADYDRFKNEGYVINCKSSSIDDTAFVPPADIKFIDPAELMKALASPNTNGEFDMGNFEELQKQYGGE